MTPPPPAYDRSIVDGPLTAAVWRLAWPTMLVNIISGNDGNGVTLAPGASLDAVINNWIGLDITGAGTLPNTGGSIQTNSSYNLVYGNAATGTLPTQSLTAQLEALYVGWFGWAADPGSYATRMQTLLTDVLQGDSVSAAALSISEEFATSPEESAYAPLASLVTLGLYAAKTYLRLHSTGAARLRYSWRQGLLVAGWLAGLLALSSLNQLGLLDAILLGILLVIIEVYVRFRWP